MLRQFKLVIFFLLFSLSSFQALVNAQKNEGSQGMNEIIVSNLAMQQMRFGIDAERLDNYWHLEISAQLAELGVKELESDFVRVAINCAYELVEETKNPSAYDNILYMMSAMKTANPDIKFFASPRPLWVAFGTKNGVPWTPYPVWIQEWIHNGTQIIDGTEYPRWKKGVFHIDKLLLYYADYLNFMHEKGFKITFLDLSNEQTIIKPWHAKVIFDSLPNLLNDGVNMPELVVPSTWSLEQGVEWLKSVDKDKNEHLAFSIAAAHNTGGEFVGETFAYEARKLGKEVWNSEMHDWMGVDSQDEIISSKILWQHIRAGFNGIDTWLFYGPYEGRGHTMIWVDPERGIRKSTKYEIFKKLVNNSNRGHYLDTPVIHPDLHTVALAKGRNLTIWVLNDSDIRFDSINFNLQNFIIESNLVEETKWEETTPRSGSVHLSVPGVSTFMTSVLPRSLYCYKMELKEPVGDDTGQTILPLIIELDRDIIVEANELVDDNYKGNLPCLINTIISGVGNRDLNILQTPASGTSVYGTDNKVFISVSDGNGDSTMIIFNVKVKDKTLPVITSVHNDTIMMTDASCKAFLPDYTGNVTATDQLARNLEITQYPLPGYLLPVAGGRKVTLTATDDSGNSTQVTFNVQAMDITPPVILSAHTDRILTANFDCQALLPNYAATLVATDNCDWPAELSIIQTPAPFSNISGNTEVIITVKDKAGNSNYTSFNVEVTDNTSPTVLCTENKTRNLEEGEMVYYVSGIEFDPVLIDDNCTIGSVSNIINGLSTLDAAELPTGTTNVVWTVKDLAGNESQCSFDITINIFTGIDVLHKKAITFYPNPTKGKIFIETNGLVIEYVKVVNILGQTIHESAELTQDNMVDLSHYPHGLYLISVSTGGKVHTLTAIKDY